MSVARAAGPVGVGFMAVGMMTLGAGESQTWNVIGVICLVLGFVLVLPGLLARW